ncbi:MULTISPECIES: hypothetical protein [Planktothricoides]|uniref:Uncharacterized protein n=1 Tax=Planktothricoides raciborskii FACHB-1370 TaxID=2949576 RepID=A0ABR8EER4_9CYAN|nr:MULTISPECIES: hypothetical protein [Planktothricoides]MBD2545268.1 hypothetical protein [Planktothricoides raciborskii FACHB-1370]
MKVKANRRSSALICSAILQIQGNYGVLKVGTLLTWVSLVIMALKFL